MVLAFACFEGLKAFFFRKNPVKIGFPQKSRTRGGTFTGGGLQNVRRICAFLSGKESPSRERRIPLPSTPGMATAGSRPPFFYEGKGGWGSGFSTCPDGMGVRNGKQTCRPCPAERRGKNAPFKFSIFSMKPPQAGRVPQAAVGNRLDLPDPFARHPEAASELLEGMGDTVVQSMPEFENGALLIGQGLEHV